jgi:arylsulfatase A-like enzyme
MSVDNFFISNPLCCPSRATLLRGQYAHNHGVYRNEPPFGGFAEFYELENESSTLATWLQSAGYRTVLLGKYLNRYPFPNDRSYVPVGWDEWYSAVKGSPFAGYKYTLNENGVLVNYDETGVGESQYMTDVLARKAGDFIDRASADEVPFFVYLNTYAPHVPVKPAKRHEDLFADIKVPRVGSYNELDVSDKPDALKITPLLSNEEMTKLDEENRARVQTMQAVDELIQYLVGVLRENGQLENTYIIFTSDNGYHLGQHRLRNGKGTPYEEDIHVPFIVRGPGIEPGSTLQGYIAGNLDFAPTIAEMAGVVPPDYVDGRSLMDLLISSAPPAEEWRSAYLIEFYGYGSELVDKGVSPPVPEYLGLRTKDYLYMEYNNGFIELYDMVKDPYQLENIAPAADPFLIQKLSNWLHQLAGCSGAQCRILDMAPTGQ